MLVDLMSTTTTDGMRLDGAFFAPQPDSLRQGPVDAVLVIHGSQGNFYTPSTKHMAEDLSIKGYASLAMNTRAHDTVWYDQAQGAYQGLAFEVLDQTRMDVRAGIDYLGSLGYRRIAILGHSMGSVRVAYYAATEDDDRVEAVICVSPVRLSYSYYMTSADAAEFQSIVEWADRLETEDKALDLMAVKFPIPQMFSATAYLDKHGVNERYNLITHAPKIKVPLYAIAGSLETHTRLKDMYRDLATAAVNSPRADYLMIEGGDHSLTNRRYEASEAVGKWLANLAVVATRA
jgi:alpha-beta hydrolase superfamily lysophospholipase